MVVSLVLILLPGRAVSACCANLPVFEVICIGLLVMWIWDTLGVLFLRY